uniref:Uncharacterized protein n=1 Tax=Avena sativa TaxID=4498 RepID=A0ACD5VBR3_AVESA
MEFATGAMGTLIPKLGELLLDEYNLKDTVKKGIGDLKAELESMQVFLVKVSSVPLDQLDPQVKNWANEVRELSYAIEDSLDSFMTRVEGVEPTESKIKHMLKKAGNKYTKFKARHEIANDMEEFERQVRKIKERYDRYKIDDVVANLATTTVDPRLSALYKKLNLAEYKSLELDSFAVLGGILMAVAARIGWQRPKYAGKQRDMARQRR